MSKKENIVARLELDTKLPEGVSQEQWNSWKDKWGDKIKRIHLPLNDDNTEFFTVAAMVPSRKTLSDYEKWVDKNPDKSKDILITDCLVTGVDVVKADDVLFNSCVGAIAEMIPIRKAIIKN